MSQTNKRAEEIQLENSDDRFGFDFQLFVPKKGISLDVVVEEKKSLATAIY